MTTHGDVCFLLQTMCVACTAMSRHVAQVLASTRQAQTQATHVAVAAQPMLPPGLMTTLQRAMSV